MQTLQTFLGAHRSNILTSDGTSSGTTRSCRDCLSRPRLRRWTGAAAFRGKCLFEVHSVSPHAGGVTFWVVMATIDVVSESAVTIVPGTVR